MNYEVGWLQDAENELAAIWRRSDEREKIDRASDSLDRLLEEEAGDAGESREPGLRIVFESPLAMKIWVNEEAKRVLVVQVWEYH
jgi:pSer/pThr/pTyr-binding forkhead associated (FHA) protein